MTSSWGWNIAANKLLTPLLRACVKDMHVIEASHLLKTSANDVDLAANLH